MFPVYDLSALFSSWEQGFNMQAIAKARRRNQRGKNQKRIRH
jgi:hypothetical protein